MGWYALLWSVPAVAAVLAVALVLACSRRLEDLASGLAHDVSRLREVRPPLRRLRHEFDASGPVVAAVWRHWAEANVQLSESPDDGGAKDRV